MRRRKNWFTDREDCKKEVKRNSPSYSILVGLDVHSSVDCWNHLPMLCSWSCPRFDCSSMLPKHLKDKDELHIDGLTVIKTAVTTFSHCPTYEYIIKESGEVFISHKKDIYWAYLERRCWHIVSSYNYIVFGQYCYCTVVFVFNKMFNKMITCKTVVFMYVTWKWYVKPP